MIIKNDKNQIILPHATWKIIERYADIEHLLQSSVPSSLSIQDLIVELIKLRNTYIVKLTLHDTCLYIKATILFLFELEHCVEHAYF